MRAAEALSSKGGPRECSVSIPTQRQNGRREQPHTHNAGHWARGNCEAHAAPAVNDRQQAPIADPGHHHTKGPGNPGDPARTASRPKQAQGEGEGPRSAGRVWPSSPTPAAAATEARGPRPGPGPGGICYLLQYLVLGTWYIAGWLSGGRGRAPSSCAQPAAAAPSAQAAGRQAAGRGAGASYAHTYTRYQMQIPDTSSSCQQPAASSQQLLY